MIFHLQVTHLIRISQLIQAPTLMIFHLQVMTKLLLIHQIKISLIPPIGTTMMTIMMTMMKMMRNVEMMMTMKMRMMKKMMISNKRSMIIFLI
jgi:hypothetical protein